MKPFSRPGCRNRGDAASRVDASQLQSSGVVPGLGFTVCMDFHMFSLCSRGFHPGSEVSSHCPKTGIWVDWR